MDFPPIPSNTPVRRSKNHHFYKFYLPCSFSITGRMPKKTVVKWETSRYNNAMRISSVWEGVFVDFESIMYFLLRMWTRKFDKGSTRVVHLSANNPAAVFWRWKVNWALSFWPAWARELQWQTLGSYSTVKKTKCLWKCRQSSWEKMESIQERTSRIAQNWYWLDLFSQAHFPCCTNDEKALSEYRYGVSHHIQIRSYMSNMHAEKLTLHTRSGSIFRKTLRPLL